MTYPKYQIKQYCRCYNECIVLLTYRFCHCNLDLADFMTIVLFHNIYRWLLMVMLWKILLSACGHF